MAKIKEIAQVNSTIISAYQNITSQTLDLNSAGLDFIELVAKEINAGRVTAREYRASLEQAKVNPLVAVKPSHAEIMTVALDIMAKVGREGLIVGKLLSLANRVKRSGSEVSEGETLAELEERIPTIKEISDEKKAEAEGEIATVEIPEVDALIVGFVAALKKATKGNLDTITFSDISTKSLEEMKVILGQMSKNRKANAKK